MENIIRHFPAQPDVADDGFQVTGVFTKVDSLYLLYTQEHEKTNKNNQ